MADAPTAGSRVRLIACDLDGTLVGAGPASERVRRAIARCTDASLRVVIATGRSPDAVAPVLRSLGLDGLHIYNNGALVQASDGRVHRRVLLAPGTARGTLRYCVANRLGAVVHVDGQALAPLYDGAPSPIRVAIANGVAAATTLPRALSARATQITVAAFDRVGRERLASLGRDLAGAAELTAAAPGVCDVVAAGVSKGAALRRLASLWGIESRDVAVVGDGDNDVSLFAAAGLRVAMGNASDRLKASADWVVAPVERDGAAEALERLIA